MIEDEVSGVVDRIRDMLAHSLGWINGLWFDDAGDLRRRAKMIFDTTSEQFFEKAQETRKAVRLRMAIMDVEHSLNRVYAQIGKLSCDVAPENGDSIPLQGDIAEKLQLAREYRARLLELRKEQEAAQRRPETRP